MIVYIIGRGEGRARRGENLSLFRQSVGSEGFPRAEGWENRRDVAIMGNGTLRDSLFWSGVARIFSFETGARLHLRKLGFDVRVRRFGG